VTVKEKYLSLKRDIYGYVKYKFYQYCIISENFKRYNVRHKRKEKGICYVSFRIANYIFYVENTRRNILNFLVGSD